MPPMHGGGHRCQAAGSGPEQECSSQEHNHSQGALNWQVLFWTAGTKLALVSKPEDQSCIPSPGVSSCWRCLLALPPMPGECPGPMAQGPLSLHTGSKCPDARKGRSVLGEPVCLRGQQIHRPPRVQDRAPGPWRPPSAARRCPLPPGTEH